MSVDSVLASNGESDDVDFKVEFDPESQRDWCELLKDVVAIGNHGGGAILIGVRDDGITVGVSAKVENGLDPATLGDQIKKHTGRHEPGCIVHAVVREGARVIVILVAATTVPIVFAMNGTYEQGGKQKAAFVEGKVYFRHNSKSEPGTTEDLERAIRREVERHRVEWLGNVRKVTEAPLGSTIAVVAPHASEETGRTVGVRLVNAPDAREIPKWDSDTTHPYRQRELVEEFNHQLGGTHRVTSHDIVCIRRAHDIDANPNFAHKTRFSSRQYSPALVDWAMNQYRQDAKFFSKARALGRNPPKR